MVAPLRTLTVPVAAEGDTLDINVTNWPTTAGFGEAVTVVVVGAGIGAGVVGDDVGPDLTTRMGERVTILEAYVESPE